VVGSPFSASAHARNKSTLSSKQCRFRICIGYSKQNIFHNDSPFFDRVMSNPEMCGQSYAYNRYVILLSKNPKSMFYQDMQTLVLLLKENKKSSFGDTELLIQNIFKRRFFLWL
jgi:hypothetical protein